MNKILEYTEKVEYFDVPQYKGGYDNIPFTHEEYCNYINELYSKLEKDAIDCSIPGDDNPDDPIAPIKVQVMVFAEENKLFVLRHLEMGW